MQFPLVWLSRWPLWLLHGAGAAMGWLAWALSPSYRRRLAANAQLAGISAPERRQAVAEAGRMVSELPRLWLRPHDKPIADPVHWQGAECLEQWLQQPKGLVLLTPHMGSFEMAAQAYVETYGARQAMTVLYRPARKLWLRQLEETARARPNLHTAPATLAGVRQMLRALKRGETVGLLPDQVPPLGMGVWAPFFGHSAYTMTLAARLVRQTGAAVGLLWAQRLPLGAGYRVTALPLPVPLPEPAQGDEADACAINASMEALIRRDPAQYLWGYHRYKAPRAAAEAST